MATTASAPATTETLAESLAAQIEAGTYTPSLLAACTPDIPVDRNPQSVRYTQFIVFVNPRLDIRSPQQAGYLILQQYPPGQQGRKPIVDFINLLAITASAGAGGVGPAKAAPPVPGGVPGDGNRAALLGLVGPLRRAGFPMGQVLAAEVSDLPAAVRGVLGGVFLPDPYQPFSAPFLHFGLCVTYEQVWEPKGYTRGELVSSISLAPGEQLTLDVHSWDKSTIKTEEELAAESEMRVSENLTQRDVHSVTREVASQVSGSLTASGITIPGTPVSLGGGVSAATTDNTKTTTEQIRERTVQASNTLKTTRKLRIEVSREVGREQRQTRVIANSNRCHTLNCHYFEVVANYVVSTSQVDLQPCLLVPMPAVEVTSPWVLCHEDILRQALLDKAFLPGFDAARTLEGSRAFVEVVKEPLSEQVQVYVQAIIDAYQSVESAAIALGAQSASLVASAGAAAAGPLGSAVATAMSVGQDQLRQAMYLAILSTNRAATSALNKLVADNANQRPPIDALKDFLAVVPVDAYRPNFSFGALWAGASLLAFPAELISSLVGYGLFGVLAPDDSGLFNAAQAADRKLKAMEKSVEDQPANVEQGYSALDVAQAQVAFAQLKCHIEDNWVHYVQAMWVREDSDQRFLRLEGYGAVAAILRNDLLGFLGNKAAFPIADRPAVKPQIDFDAIIQGVAAQAYPPQLITVPTQGTVLESVVGGCDACEDFIQQNRLLDLRRQTAKAREEEAEAQRREMRLTQHPPDLSDPRAVSGNVTINVTEPEEPHP